MEFEFTTEENPELKQYLQNEDFVGIVGRVEFLLLNEAGNIDKENTALICIFDPDKTEHPEELVQGYKDVLQIRFWDVEESFVNYRTITPEQGTTIKEFIEKNRSSRFLVHCEAGMSRSAGVGKAIECLKHHKGDRYGYRTSGSAIGDFSAKTNRYHPNLTVFDAVLGDLGV